jgi:hypothetical protein
MKTKKERIVDHSLDNITEALGFSEEDVKEWMKRIIITSSVYPSKSQVIEELAEEFSEDPVVNILIGLAMYPLWKHLENK